MNYRTVRTVTKRLVTMQALCKRAGSHSLALSRRYQTAASTGVWGHILRDQTTQDGSMDLGKEVLQARAEHSNAWRLVCAYRRHGHRYAATNPVCVSPVSPGPELEAARYGLEVDTRVPSMGLVEGGGHILTVGELGQRLSRIYCGPLSLETEYIESEQEQEWLHKRYQEIQGEALTTEERKNLAGDMVRSQVWDHYLAAKFQSVKRYGGEGAESMVGFFSELLRSAGELGVKQVVLGQAHRGRLNLLTGMLGFPPVAMFRKMKGLPEFPPEQYGVGDVLSHLTSSLDTAQGVRMTMLPNPSHLEAVNPVALGKARAKELGCEQGAYGDGREGDSALCVQVHGDGALTGQGINQETLQLSQVPHYSVGGSLHLVVNNQVAFTAPGDRGRSSTHCTGLASQVQAPVIHVNGDSPEDVVRATRLALEYRHKFRKDVFVDLVCFRRWGHNELDDPTMTNPALYSVIHARRSIPDIYTDSLIQEGVLTEEERTGIVSAHTDLLAQNFRLIETYNPERTNLQRQWSSIQEPGAMVTVWDTGVDTDVLRYVGAQSVKCPEEFKLHPQLAKTHVEARRKKLEAGSGLDWGTCEALAMGSLLFQGWNVRISGQDVGRATFAHRHAMLVDQDTNEIYIPFNHMVDNQGKLEIANSILSEEAVLGFEYGMAVDSPHNLIIWEAQFGDFFNGAQIILDTFVANGESKWGLQCGLVMLLPHGMDGAGPEHSSCRMERFLQMSDSSEITADTDRVNWEIVQPSTGAQYFHLLRRQMVRSWRKPLVVVAPKTLLRLPAACSSISELAPGSTFQTVISDPSITNPDKVEKVVFVSGRHYYTLAKYIEDNNIQGVAVVRLESLCPFPAEKLQEEVKKYKNAKSWVWSQEEHRNQGAWAFVKPRMENLVGVSVSYAGREELCQPAVGVGQIHRQEADRLLQDTFHSK